MRFAVVMVAAIACGRIGFEARTTGDAASSDGRTVDAAHDAAGDAAVCLYSPMCSTGESTCCTATTTTCTITPTTCTGTVTACDVMTQAGCSTGAACCIVPPATEPSCYGPFPPPPC